MAHDVFICYSSEDKKIADAACAKLESAGIRCWIAPRDPIPGIPYGGQIIKAIAEARVLLLLFSGNANRSEHVRRELELASEGEKIIIPFRIENVLPSGSLQYYITGVHWLDAMSPPMEARFGELISLIKKLLDQPEIEPVPAAVVARATRKFGPLAVALAAVILLAVVAGAALLYQASRPKHITVAAAKHVASPRPSRKTQAKKSVATVQRPSTTPAVTTVTVPAPEVTPRIIYIAAKPVTAVPQKSVARHARPIGARAPVLKPTSAPARPSPTPPTPAPVIRVPQSITYHTGNNGFDWILTRVDSDHWRILRSDGRSGSGTPWPTVGRAEIAGTPGTVARAPSGLEWMFIPDLGAPGQYAHLLCFSTVGPGICDANKRPITITSEY